MWRCTLVVVWCLGALPAQADVPITLLGQLGGESRAVAVSPDGTLAYLGEGPFVTILDLSNPGDIRVVGRSERLPRVPEDIIVEGGYAFVADGLAGLHVLDVSDASAPRAMSRCGIPSWPTSNRGLHLCLSGRYVYFADGETGLRIYDASNPAEPVCVTVFEIKAYDVAVSGGYAYVASRCDGLTVLDVSDPCHPRAAAHLDLPICASEIDLSGGYAFLTGVRQTSNDRQGLYIVDVRDPAKPAVTGCIDLQYPEDLVVAGKFAYVVDRWGSVEFIRITNPAMPARVGGYTTAGRPVAICAAEASLYVAQAYAGLEVIDVSRIAQPAVTGRYATTDVQDVAVSGAYAYVASTNTGMQVVDVSDPAAPAWMSWLDLDYTLCVSAAEGRVCVGDGWKLKTIDVSDPLEPQVAGECNAGGEIRDIALAGAYACAAAGNGLAIVDLSNPQNPWLVSRCEVNGSALAVCVSGRYAYLAGWGGLDIIDISDSTRPLLTGHYVESGSLPLDVAIRGDYAYLACGSAGVRVIDVSEPWLPGRVSGFATGDAKGVAIQGRCGYLTGTPGLRVFDVSDPISLPRLGGDDRVGSQRLTVSSDFVYTADHAGGLVILKADGLDDAGFDDAGPDTVFEAL